MVVAFNQGWQRIKVGCSSTLDFVEKVECAQGSFQAYPMSDLMASKEHFDRTNISGSPSILAIELVFEFLARDRHFGRQAVN